MNNSELLKVSRDLLLSLHKSLVDFERETYERTHGRVTSGQFLNLLLEHPDLAWLRQFSTLIVDIDEMFAQKDGYANDAVSAHLATIRDVVFMRGPDREFRARFEGALQQDANAAAKQGELRQLLSQEDFKE